MRMIYFLTIVCGLLLGCGKEAKHEGSLRVAVASNFAPILRELSKSYTEEFGQEVVLTSGSTGVLYAQIENGAPFDLFLAADETRPRMLVDGNLADGDSLVTYALGRLVLACATGEKLPSSLKALSKGKSITLAMANERLAPFGVAAMDVLKQAGVLARPSGITLVRGENAAHAWHFLASGAADYALGPWSMAKKDVFPFRLLDSSRHDSIAQVGVVLDSSPEDHFPRRFLRFLKRESSRRMIKAAGYDVENG